MPLFLSFTEPVKTWVPIVFGLGALVAALTDILHDKIYNWLTMPALVAGVGIAVYEGCGLKSVSAVGVAAVVFIPLFFLDVLGGGDVKLVMALASVLGVSATFDLISGCFIAGGAGALVVLVMRGRVKVFTQEVFKFFKTLMIRQLVVEFPKLDKNIKAPFGLAILAGYLYAI